MPKVTELKLPNGDTYSGDVNEAGEPHGSGISLDPDGSKYEGGFVDGKMHGIGTYTSRDGGTYNGEFKDGNANGTGFGVVPNGKEYEKYSCEFKDGKMHGMGTYTSLDGIIYKGEFKDGKKNGIGTYFFPNGSKYTGGIKDGKRTGTGTYIFPSGAVYEGDFIDDKRTGIGTYTFPDRKKIYRGEFKDGEMDGRGTYIFPGGAEYTGQISGGKMDGIGTYLFSNGLKYEGKFRDNKKHGEGVYIYPNGERYQSEFKNDIINKRGTLSYLNGPTYVGDIRPKPSSSIPYVPYVEPHGKGTLTTHDGKLTIFGDFENGKPHGRCAISFQTPDGLARYEGQFENGMPTAFGLFTKAIHGTKPAGATDGKDFIITAAGQDVILYYGGVTKNKKHGSGIERHPDGSQFEGIFENDKIKSGTWFKNGEVIKKVGEPEPARAASSEKLQSDRASLSESEESGSEQDDENTPLLAPKPKGVKRVSGVTTAHTVT